MCGIAGILTSRTELDLEKPLQQMKSALRHRGPDGEGLEIARLPSGIQIGLAHTRLSILDLSVAGRQPMSDAPSGSLIVYNGEVYNHMTIRESLKQRPFTSRTDTETILKGWSERGPAILGDLRGMFALAMYDSPRKQFCLARDRMGIKPLYICRRDEQTWIFASEVRAILASGLVDRYLDEAALESYLAFGSVISPRTLIDGIQSLTPGESWTFALDEPNLKPTRSRYWQAPFRSHSSSVPDRDDALAIIRERMKEATQMRMLSDVPVGVFLSGGIDSSGIVATLADAGHQVHSFSVTFDEKEYDESCYASTVAKHFQTNHTELRLRSDDILGQFDHALASYDQPSADGLNSFFIAEEVRRAGIKVALSGLGGDELFAGYPMFQHANKLDNPLLRFSFRSLLPIAQRVWPNSTKFQKLGELLQAEDSRVDRFAAYRHLMKRPRYGSLLHKGSRFAQNALPENLFAELTERTRDLDAVNAHSLLEISLYLQNVLLRDTDQMSMAHGLEVRVPLIDHALVEAVCALPGRMKLSPGKRGTMKGLLLDALPVPLPRTVTHRKKMGFVLPWSRWMRNELHQQVSTLLGDRDTCEQIGLSSGAVKTMWCDFCASRPSIRAEEIMALLNLMCWCRNQKVRLRAGSAARLAA